MKKFIVAGAAIVGLGFASGAQAADLGVPRAPVADAVVAPVFDWSGFYVGLHAGGAVSRNRYVGAANGLAPDWGVGTIWGVEPGGFIGGAQIGYNWQFSPYGVFGVEASASWTSINRSFVSTFGAADDVYRARTPFVGSLTARLGYAAGPALLYVKGGLALATFSFSYVDAVGPNVGTGSASSTRAGWTVGLGAEYAINQNWSVAAEYNYAKFGGFVSQLNATDAISSSHAVHSLTARLNYRFWTGPSAVVARY